ncbi:MAG: cytochrome c3 family protein [Deltaproteobacteria bacterium]|nr:cytochrome c3 family protein [Deltaproteobacteria bacterium]
MVIAVNTAFSADEKEPPVDTGPAEMTLKTTAARKSAKFPHKKHQENFTCGICHHSKSEDGRQKPYFQGMKIRSCVSCHNKEDMQNPKFNTFKLAAHGLCKECHKKNKGSAPTKCSGCHIK